VTGLAALGEAQAFIAVWQARTAIEDNSLILLTKYCNEMMRKERIEQD
jgi:hypothetical protein